MFSYSHFHQRILQYPSSDSKHILMGFSLKSHHSVFFPFFQLTLTEHTYLLQNFYLQNATHRYLFTTTPRAHYYYQKYSQNHSNNYQSQIPHSINPVTKISNTAANKLETMNIPLTPIHIHYLNPPTLSSYAN